VLIFKVLVEPRKHRFGFNWRKAILLQVSRQAMLFTFDC
jgi:hypothetical protein